MKIAVDISQIAYEGTGVANYTSELVRHLLTQDTVNDYLLLGFSLRRMKYINDFYEEIKILNKKVSAKFIHIPQSMSGFMGNRLHFPNLEIFTGEIDIYHSSDWIQYPSKARKVTTVHDLVVYKYPETSDPGIISMQKKRLTWVKKECDLIITDSESTKRDLLEILHTSPNQTEVVYPGITPKFSRRTETEIERVRQKYSLRREYVLTVGTMEPRKNLVYVVNAFERFGHHQLIAASRHAVDLVMVGHSGWGGKIRPVKNVRLLGQVNSEDLPALYSGASFFIFPSLYEGFGLPVIEAQSCGCPVICSDRGSLKEVGEKSVMYIDPEMEEDLVIKMTKMYVENDLRAEYRAMGYQNAKRFSWKKSAQQILNLYEKIHKYRS